MELLKEQQNRILDRQMSEAVLRRRTQDNNLTHHLERHRESGSSGSSVVEEFGTAPNTARAQWSGCGNFNERTSRITKTRTSQSRFRTKIKGNGANFNVFVFKSTATGKFNII